MTMTDPVSAALQALEAACVDFGMPLPQAIHEKADELKIRLFLRCIPNDRLKESELEHFLMEVLRRKPSRELLLSISEAERGPRLSEEELIRLEESQNGRCALCGCFLVPAVSPQVDHVIPVALRGKSEISNYQLLCQQCNLGKRKLIGWIIGAPFLYDLGKPPSLRLRYCALARSGGMCENQSCGATSRSAELKVVPIIPVARGGRWIFDNLMVLCGPHAAHREMKLFEEARRKVMYARYQNKLLGRPAPIDLKSLP